LGKYQNTKIPKFQSTKYQSTKIPNPKSKIQNNIKISISKIQNKKFFWLLEFGGWNFILLEFGIFFLR